MLRTIKKWATKPWKPIKPLEPRTKHVRQDRVFTDKQWAALSSFERRQVLLYRQGIAAKTTDSIRAMGGFTTIVERQPTEDEWNAYQLNMAIYCNQLLKYSDELSEWEERWNETA